jgi:hypothetical protein
MAKLTNYEVQERLGLVDSEHVTEALYDMGKTLMGESGQRSDYLDAKSARIAGYIGAIVGLLVSTFPIWTSAIDRWAVFVATIGSLAGAVGGAIALYSMWPKKFLLPSDTDWLESDALGDPERLKKYYVSSMHLVITSQERVSDRRVSAIKSSQVCLALMVLSLFIVLVNASYRVATKTKVSPQLSDTSPQLSDHAVLAVSSARQ